jgi:hypothetical protein
MNAQLMSTAISIAENIPAKAQRHRRQSIGTLEDTGFFCLRREDPWHFVALFANESGRSLAW